MEKQLLCHLSHSHRNWTQTEGPIDLKEETQQKKLLHFLDVQLRSGAHHSINDEYPSLFGEFPGGESLFIEQAGEIVAHAGFVVREYQHEHFRMKIGILGSVVTAPSYRGRGMASTLVSAAIAHLKAKGCVLSILWGDATDFYQPLGFYRAGQETDFIFSSSHVPLVDELPIEFDRKRHTEAIWRLYQQHTSKLDRSLEEQKRLCDVPHAKIYVTEKEGLVTSYIAVNKGADFQNFIHEWGGDLQEVARNIASVQRNIFPDTNLTLIAPSHYSLVAVEAIAIEKKAGILGLVKVIDRSAMTLIYLKYLTRLGLNHRWDKQNQILHCEGAVYSLANDADFSEIIFGGTLAGLPPLPFFLWGFDSI